MIGELLTISDSDLLLGAFWPGLGLSWGFGAGMGLELCKVDGAGRGAGGAAGGDARFKDPTSSLRNRLSAHVLSKFSCIDFIDR